ncbi:endonuclease [Pelobacter seleniigenes]|uniref:endonuclease n=1 Tax=Pelobacter seleniigenes TaxID=407188 RepID=UPI0004A75FE0|nr:endonuclease [Pelobacter seleniigenes]
MDIADRKAELSENIRGDIALIYFYMNDAYPGRGIISGKNRKLFEAWDKQDPVDAWECERERRIQKVQGNGTQFVMDRCLSK